uniref:Uncharacterized protein n=1 Tax=Branchiostoma floridae TaxID=7739 RepID=C3YXP5_BRAFL|eukprot:XP_002598842.1 hypothetical protein BRAFLDRAFT_74481 [Branchiostoma floridae]
MPSLLHTQSLSLLASRVLCADCLKKWPETLDHTRLCLSRLLAAEHRLKTPQQVRIKHEDIREESVSQAQTTKEKANRHELTVHRDKVLTYALGLPYRRCISHPFITLNRALNTDSIIATLISRCGHSGNDVKARK